MLKFIFIKFRHWQRINLRVAAVAMMLAVFYGFRLSAAL